MKSQDRIKRIKDLEEKFDAASRAVAELEKALDDYSDVREDISDLEEYMDSGAWMQDFEADGRGEFPAGMKRGILSEDGLYNLLSDSDEVLRRMRSVAAKAAAGKR